MTLLEYKIKSKTKFLFLHYKIDNQSKKETLIKILKQKVCLLYTNNYVVNSLSDNYQYVPKVHLKIGVDRRFIEVKKCWLNNSNVFVTTHPLKNSRLVNRPVVKIRKFEITLGRASYLL